MKQPAPPPNILLSCFHEAEPLDAGDAGHAHLMHQPLVVGSLRYRPVAAVWRPETLPEC